MSGGPTRFVIVSAPRCGTHMLRTTLDSHPHIRCRAESFNPHLIADEPYDGACPTAEVLHHHVWSSGEDPDVRAMGFAVHRGGAPLGQWTDIWDLLVEDRDVHVVMLHRHDLFRRYLSYVLMRERNRSGNRADFTPAPRAVEAETLRDEFLRFEAELADFRHRFSAHPRLQVAYEDLTRRFAATTGALQHFLGVTQHPVAPRTPRNPTTPVQDLVTNLAELRQRFEGTRWQWFFADDPGAGRLTAATRVSVKIDLLSGS